MLLALAAISAAAPSAPSASPGVNNFLPHWCPDCDHGPSKPTLQNSMQDDGNHGRVQHLSPFEV